MSEPSFDVDRFRNAFLLLLVVVISISFAVLIQDFFTPILLAAIVTGLCMPLQVRLADLFRGRTAIAAGCTVVLVFTVLIGPLLLFFSMVARQALELADTLRPWLAGRFEGDAAGAVLSKIDLPAFLEPYRGELLGYVGKLIDNLGEFLFTSITGATRGTAEFALALFLMLYAMFFFLRDGRGILERILYYMPLRSEDELRLVDRFVSVTRATIKGTLVVGAVQGGLAGLAFWAVGIPGAAFWATVMAILSIIPGLGTALIWVPAAAWLYLDGQVGAAAALALWCIGVVGTIDNVLRPRLVGRDTEMSDLLVLLSTLGGLLLLGPVGFLIGPILAALFVTVWELYGEAFAPYLPDANLTELRPIRRKGA